LGLLGLQVDFSGTGTHTLKQIARLPIITRDPRRFCLSKDSVTKWPNPDELRKDMEEFFSHKYGDKIKLGVLGAEPDQARTADEGTDTKNAPLNLEFEYLPRDIKKYLDRFVVKQDAAKKVLATTICDHYNHIKRCSVKGPCKEYSKQNIIMLGPTGVGKTYLVRA